MPFEHHIGRLSEEFGGALPSVILAEMDRLPAGCMEQIVEYRAYARSYFALQAAKTAEARRDLRQGSSFGALAEQIHFAIVQEGLARG